MVLKDETIIMSKDEFRELLHDRVTLNVIKMMNGLKNSTVLTNAQLEANVLTQTFMEKHLLLWEEDLPEITEPKVETEILRKSFEHVCKLLSIHSNTCPWDYSISLNLKDCGKDGCSCNETAECWEKRILEYYRKEQPK